MKKSNHWPFGIAFIYIAFVIILIGLVIFSQYQKADLVTENYYEKEIRYQQQINRIQRTESLSSPIHWTHDQSNKQLTIQFPEEMKLKTIKGQILFFRPSDAQQDKIIALHLSPEGTQTISTEHLSQGYWKLKIFWQINDQDFYKESPLIIK